MFSRIFGRSKNDPPTQERVAIEEMVERGIQRAIQSYRQDFDLMDEVQVLKREKNRLEEKISSLKVEKSAIDEKHAREKREIEHKVGLNRERVDQELELARREAKMEAMESNQEQRDELFGERMEFFEEQMEKNAELLHRVIERLPDADIIARVGTSCDCRNRKEE